MGVGAQGGEQGEISQEPRLELQIMLVFKGLAKKDEYTQRLRRSDGNGRWRTRS